LLENVGVYGKLKMDKWLLIKKISFLVFKVIVIPALNVFYYMVQNKFSTYNQATNKKIKTKLQIQSETQ